MNVSRFLVCEFSDLSLNYNNGGDNKVKNPNRNAQI